jgi:hypothetical protein
VHPSNHYYGHARVLAEACGLEGDPPIWGLLQHGWNPDHGIRDTSWLPAWFPKLVWGRRALELARADGTPHVRGIGAPFLYLRDLSPPTKPADEVEGTLVFPYHGWEEQPGARNDHLLAEQIAERETGPVTVSLYWFDHGRPEVRAAYESRGLRTITFGRREQPDFLRRQLDEIGRHRRVVTNRVSTAIWYAGAVAREIEVYGPVFGADSTEEAEAFARVQRDRWPALTAGPVGGDEAVALGEDELGGDLLLDREALIAALGWSPARRVASTVARTGIRARSAVRHRLAPPVGVRPFTLDSAAEGLRDLHVVVPTVGRATAVDVVRALLDDEPRLARVTVVTQDSPPVVTDDLVAAGAAIGVPVEEDLVAERIGCARARRLGSTHAATTWIGFVDDDIRFEQGHLSGLVRRAEERGWGGACGVVVDDARNSRAYRAIKPVLFRGIFRDPRQQAAVASEPVESPVLSGGLTVFRRDVYAEVAPLAERFVGYSWGEDVTLSFAASRHHRLGIDPAVRVANLTTGSAGAASTPLAVAEERLRSYRRFAELNAHRRRDWLAYAGVALGAGAQGLAETRAPAAVGLVAAELRRAARGVARP